MTKQAAAARPIAEVRATAEACHREHSSWPTRDSQTAMRRAEKALIDASTTPGEIRDALTYLRRVQHDTPTKTRAALMGGAYMKLANACEAAIAAEREAHAEEAAAEREHLAGQAARTATATDEWEPEPTPTPPVPVPRETRAMVYAATSGTQEIFRDMDLDLLMVPGPVFGSLERAQAWHQADVDEQIREAREDGEQIDDEQLDWTEIEDDVWQACSEETGIVYRVTACPIR